MEGIYAKSPEALSHDAGQAEAAISAQLVGVKSKSAGMGEYLNGKVIQALLYATVVLMPLFYLPWTSNVGEYNKQMLLVGVSAVCLVLWLFGVVVSGKLTIRTSPVDKGVFGLLIATVIATITSVTPVTSVFGSSGSLSSSLLSVIALTVFYFLAVNTLHDRGRTLRSALLVSLVLATLAGVFQLFSWYILPGVFTHSNAFTTVGSLNTLGVLAAVGLALYTKTLYRGSNRMLQVLSVIGIAASVLILAVLNWWVLWVVALGGMLAMIAFDSLNMTQLSEDYGGRRNRFALSRFVVPMIVIILGAVLLLIKFNGSSLGARIPVEIAPSYSSSRQMSIEVLKQKTLSGWGPENFSIAFDRMSAGSLANTQFANARFLDGASEVFTLVAQQGAIGLLTLVLLFGCFVQVIRRFGGTISASVARGEGVSFAAQSTGTLSMLLALVVALFLYPMNLTLWFVFYVVLALAALIVSGDRSRTVDIEERPLYSLSASLGFIVGLILVLSGMYLASVRYLADVRYASAVSQSDPAKAMEGLGRAIGLNAASDQYLRDASQVALMLLRAEIAKKDGDAEQPQRIQNFIASTIQLAQRATTAQPNESLNWNNLGIIYQSMTGLVDNVEKLAEDAFKKAGELRPGDPTFDNAIGQMWLARADLIRQVAQRATGSSAESLKQQQKDALVKAEEAFKRAIATSPAYGLAIYNLGAAYDRQNNVKAAITQLEKIAPYNSNQPVLMFELGLLYVRNDQKNQAVAALQRAVLLAPQYANARWYLALLLEERNDIPGALAQLREILKGNTDNTALTDKIRALEAGQRQIPPEEVIETKPLQ